MRRTTHSRAMRTALLALALALAPAGCGGTSSDKAGGAHKLELTVLTMANGNGDSAELEPFAAAVARLSGGTLRIAFSNSWREGEPNYGSAVIGDVETGKADLGWSGSRNFDSVGVRSFDALHAPLLIDSYPLERKALESPLVSRMLAGLEPLGVVGLGVLSGPMRKPLGVSPLVRPEDYEGTKLALQESEVAEQAMRALGARGVRIASGGEIDGYDGVEQQLAAIDGNEYDKVGKYLTANVNLWPRPIVLFMNPDTFDGLSDEQQGALRDAARDALPATLAGQQRGDEEGAANLCRRGLKFVSATDSDLAALRRAVQPVYDRLERDAQTRTAIDEIEAMRSELASPPAAPTCTDTGSAQGAVRKTTAIDGVYRVHTTAADLRAAGAPDAEIIPENYGSYEIVLDRGRFSQGSPTGGFGEGTYAVAGDKVTLTFTRGARGRRTNRPGEQFEFRWSLYRDQLTLEGIEGKVSPIPLRAKPWRRTGNAR